MIERTAGNPCQSNNFLCSRRLIPLLDKKDARGIEQLGVVMRGFFCAANRNNTACMKTILGLYTVKFIQSV